ncbi:MAG: hypothetical protein U1C57_04055 [Candidatus Doudnabacteria bacterium]|nr:hypothetical protein [Candidatus Doudnabacteria bacterium]
MNNFKIDFWPQGSKSEAGSTTASYEKALAQEDSIVKNKPAARLAGFVMPIFYS